MTNGYALRVALGALAGLGFGTAGAILLPPILVPNPPDLSSQLAPMTEAPAPAAAPPADTAVAPAADPAAAPPATEPATEAAAEPAAEPASEMAATPAAETASDFVADPAADPASDPAVETASLGASPEVAVAAPPPPTAAPAEPSATDSATATQGAALPALDPAADPGAVTGPRFDTVRVEPDGIGLVAGRAEPGTLVAVLAGEEVVGEAEADAQGRFVAFLDVPPSPEPRALSLRDAAGGVSEETVILAPTAHGPTVLASAAPPDEAPPADQSADQSGPSDAAPAGAADGSGGSEALALAAPADPVQASPPEATGQGALTQDAGTDAAAAEAPVAATGQPTAPGQTTADAAEAPAGLRQGPDGSGPAALAGAVGPDDSPGPALRPEVLAAALGAPAPPDLPDPPGQAAVLLSDAEGVRVLQPALPAGADREILATVALDAISYDGAGEVLLQGRGTPGDAVRLYLDNRPVAEATIGPDGTWSAPLTDSEPGIYTLRLDQVDPDGEVVSRIESPFQRERRDDIETALSEARRLGGSETIALRTVQPGNTLWAIARERYGEPLMYVRVFEANRDRIRNPDLIYPGQVFVLPEAEAP